MVKMILFDAHLHLARLPEPLETARELHERGYRYRAIACEPWEWKAVHELWEAASAKGWQEGCGISFGIHPMVAEDVAGNLRGNSSSDCWSKLRHLLEAFPDAQVGEAGLDRRFGGYEPGGAQEEIFRRQAKMALELGRDLQIHCVGDYGRIVQILRDVGFSDARAGLKCGAGIKRPRPIFHRFGGDAGIVKAGLSLGALFSIHADSLRKKAMREALAHIPQANLLFETDADETFCETHGLNGTAPQAFTPKQIADALVDRLKQAQINVFNSGS